MAPMKVPSPFSGRQDLGVPTAARGDLDDRLARADAKEAQRFLRVAELIARDVGRVAPVAGQDRVQRVAVGLGRRGFRLGGGRDGIGGGARHRCRWRRPERPARRGCRRRASARRGPGQAGTGSGASGGSGCGDCAARLARGRVKAPWQGRPPGRVPAACGSGMLGTSIPGGSHATCLAADVPGPGAGGCPTVPAQTAALRRPPERSTATRPPTWCWATAR